MRAACEHDVGFVALAGPAHGSRRIFPNSDLDRTLGNTHVKAPGLARITSNYHSIIKLVDGSQASSSPPLLSSAL